MEVSDDGWFDEGTLNGWAIIVERVAVVPLGPVGFLETSGLDPSAGDLWYRFETTRRGTLSVEAIVPGAAGDDTFTAAPGQAALSGEGYSSEAAGFGVVHGIARYGGFDTARLDDSSGDDRFVARPAYAKLEGEGFYSRAKWFDEVGAYAIAGGEDRAFLFGSPQDDTFTATPAEGRFAGPGFSNAACSFEAVEAIANRGGHDKAYLYDSALDDLLEAGEGWARLSSNNDPLDFLYEVVAFETVRACSSTGHDVKQVAPEVDFLDLAGPWLDRV